MEKQLTREEFEANLRELAQHLRRWQREEGMPATPDEISERAIQEAVEAKYGMKT